jgi:hypothetical protein
MVKSSALRAGDLAAESTFDLGDRFSGQLFDSDVVYGLALNSPGPATRSIGARNYDSGSTCSSSSLSSP